MQRKEYSVDCPEHGRQQAAFVCRHLAASLNTGGRVGYFCSEEDPDSPRPDAWCAECEEKRIACGGDWTDESELSAGVTMVCGECYDRIREINVGSGTIAGN